MNKRELVQAIAERVGDRKTATRAVDGLFETIQRAVAKGERVTISGFGVFEKVNRPARQARNPATGERIQVKATTVPRFRPGSGFKAAVSSGRRR